MFTPNTSKGRSSETITVPLNGFFDNGVWHCNCSSRLPAARFEVKKQGPNIGRWFYTCPAPKHRQCNFFLWDDIAKEREKKVVVNNSGIEPISDIGNPKEQTPASTTFEEHMRGSTAQKKAAKAKEDVDEFDLPLSPCEEKRVVDAVARVSVEASSPRTSLPETPRKMTRTSIFDMSGSKRKREVELAYPTPNTSLSSARDDVFTSPGTSKGSLQYVSRTANLMSPSVTPTPIRFRDAEQASNRTLDPRDPATAHDYDLTKEVMELLKDQNLDQETSTKVRDVLNRHALKSRGIVRGREITREALKSKEIQIAELQLRISHLETERESDKLCIKKLRGDMVVET